MLNRRMLVVFDLDGTLADDLHRQHHLDQETKDWDGYFAECGKDQVIEPVAAIARALTSQTLPDGTFHWIEIWTGRSEAYKPETVEWLCANRIPFQYLKMRPEGDYRPDTVLKGEWLNDPRLYGEKPDLIFDDRTKSVEFWRKHGIVCCQVAQHDY